MTISFSDWLSESIEHFRTSDRSVVSRIARPPYYVYVGAFLTATQQRQYGTNIFDREWDTLIVLDACRVDALREVADEYDFITQVNSITSVGSTSFEWLNHTFSAEYLEDIQETAYITGNGYTERVFESDGHTGHAPIPFGPENYNVVDSSDFGYLEELWRVDFEDSSEWIIGSGDGRRVNPRYTTDRTIQAIRNSELDRSIVHYMYPHDPYPLAGESLQRPFDPLKAGTASRDDVWGAYLDNLKLVLDEVELLLENIDSERVVITADHGEAFGEYGFYRHVIGCPIPCMRRVPWVKTTATDKGKYEPTAPKYSLNDSVAVQDRLEQLGYL